MTARSRRRNMEADEPRWWSAHLDVAAGVAFALLVGVRLAAAHADDGVSRQAHRRAAQRSQARCAVQTCLTVWPCRVCTPGEVG